MDVTEPRCGKAHQAAFTVIELLITMVVAGVLLAVVVPGFSNTMKNGRITAATNQFVATVQYVRTEAIKRRSPVTICRSSDVANNPTCGSGDGWQDGWFVFTDGNADGNFNNDDEILKRFAGFSKSDLNVVVEAAADTLGDSLTFAGNGFPQLAAANSGRNIVFCDDRANDDVARVLNLSSTGRPRAMKLGQVPGLLASCE